MLHWAKNGSTDVQVAGFLGQAEAIARRSLSSHRQLDSHVAFAGGGMRCATSSRSMDASCRAAQRAGPR